MADFLFPDALELSTRREDVPHYVAAFFQSYFGSRMSGTFRRKRKFLSPIFSVLSCTRMALCLLVRPSCSCSTFFEGAGVCLNVFYLLFPVAS